MDCRHSVRKSGGIHSMSYAVQAGTYGAMDGGSAGPNSGSSELSVGGGV